MKKGKSAYRKDIIRTIKNGKKRFISILVIVALGVVMSSGLRAACVDLRATADAFFDEQNLYDIAVQSTLGLTDADVSALSSLSAVEEASGGFTETVYLSGQTHESVLIKTICSSGMNSPYLESGTLPEAENEIAVTETYLKDTGKQLGDTVTIEEIEDEDDEEEDESDEDADEDDDSSFYCTEFIITATVQDPADINNPDSSTAFRDTSTTDYTFFVAESAVSSDIYTVVYLTVSGAAELNCYSDEYEALIADVIDIIEDEIKSDREQARTQEIIDEAEDEISEAEDEMYEAFDEAEEEIAEAEEELESARSELDDGWEEYYDGLEEVESAEAELDDGEDTLDEEEADTLALLAAAREELEESSTQLEAAWAEYEENEALISENLALAEEGLLQIEDAITQLESALSQIEDALLLLEESTSGSLESDPDLLSSLSEEELNALAAQQEALNAQYDELLSQYESLSAQLEELYVQLEELEENIETLKAAQTELAAAKEELESAQAELESGQSELEENEALALSEFAAARQTISESRRTLAEAAAELAEGLAELEDGEAEYAEGLAEFEDSVAEYEAEKADALEEIADARAELADIDTATWYVQDRSSLSGYANVESDSGAIESIGNYFPVIFLAVAVLISLTTITRMVDEERGLIGTYKALGFSNGEILRKYIIYSLSACLAGSIIGEIGGFIGLPAIVFIIFRVMYSLPSYRFTFDLLYGLMGPAIFFAGVGFATWFACRRALKQKPAVLMRPKTPKAGSRVFLEYIPFIWKHLSFLNKVTARNLFRYKKRLAMTVVGIAGCSGLLVFGFAIKDSVADFVVRQYDDIYQYDLMAVAADYDELEEYMDRDTDNIADYISVRIDSVTIENNGEKISVQLIVVDDEYTDAFSSYITLLSTSGETLTLNSEDIFITRNAGRMLDFSAGDTVTLQDLSLASGQAEVASLVQNYLGNNVYMTSSAYEDIFGEEYEANGVLALFTGSVEDAEGFAEELSLKDSITSAVATQTLEDEFDIAFILLTMVVYIIIIMAALLAFVVLFTLSTTNISEREREIATIKVLGFHDKEVHLYVNKEMMILTVLGIIPGLVLGYFLGHGMTPILKMPGLHFAVSIHPVSYVIAIVLTIVFALLVQLITNRVLNKVDPVEALKSIE